MFRAGAYLLNRDYDLEENWKLPYNAEVIVWAIPFNWNRMMGYPVLCLCTK